MHIRQKSLRKLFCNATLGIVLGSSVTGCSEYWWTRGQPPSVAEQMAKAQKRLIDSRQQRGASRAAVGAASEQIELSLHQAVALVRSNAPAEQVVEQLAVTEQAFLQLDQTISVGSRAALGELSGQLRVISATAKDGVLPPYPSIGLFTARVFSFLANELVMPAPGV